MSSERKALGGVKKLLFVTLKSQSEIGVLYNFVATFHGLSVLPVSASTLRPSREKTETSQQYSGISGRD